MKLFSTFLTLVLFIATLGQAQSFKFANAPTEIISVPTDGIDGTGEYTVNFSVTNTGDDALALMAFRSAAHGPGHESLFCWDLCYPKFEDSSANAVWVNPGDTTGYGRYLTFYTNMIPGYSEITMTIADSVTGESVSHTYKISVGGILSAEDKLAAASALSTPYPNPARDEAFVKVNFPSGIQTGQLDVFNLIGKRVMSVPVQQPNSEVRLEVKSLNSGIYFVYLTGEGKELTSRKMIIVK